MASINVGKQIFEGTSVAVPDEQGSPFQFANEFRSVEQPKLMSATASAVSDVGDMISGAAKAAVNITEASATNALEQRIDPIMNQKLGELQNIKDSLASGPQGPELPDAIKNHVASVNTYAKANANGTLDDSYYHAAILKAQKDVRAMYPRGFRDYIDSNTDKITKLGHANETMAALTHSINASVGKLAQEREKIFTVALEAAKYDSSIVPEIVAFQNGKKTPGELLLSSSKIMAGWHDLDRRTKELTLSTGDANTRARLATESANIEGPTIASNHFTAALNAQDAKTPEDLTKAMEADPKYAARVAQQYTNVTLPAMEKALRDSANRVRGTDKDGQPWSWASQGLDVEAYVNRNMAFPKAFVQAWKDKDGGMLYATANAEKAAQEAYTANKTKEPGTEVLYRNVKLLQDAVGSAGLAGSETAPAIHDLVKALQAPANPNTTPGTQGLLNQNNAASAAGQPDPISGKPIRTKTEMEHNRAVSRTNNASDNDAFIGEPMRLIQDKTVPVIARRYQVARLFAPENYGTIASLQEKGQMPKFQEMTSDAMTNSIKELGPSSWKVYRDWVMNTSSIDLLRPAVQNLNFLITQSELPISYSSGEGKNSPKFYSPKTNDSIYGFDKINQALEPAIKIAREEGQDVDAYTYLVFQALGAHEDVLKAIKASRTKPEPKKTTE